jgi:DNA-binding protein H-NS
MDIQELQSLRDKMAEVEKQVIEDITAKATLLGFVLVKLDTSAPPAPSKTKEPKKPKYADANGNTWSGKGKKPKWLTDALLDGKTLEDLAT